MSTLETNGPRANEVRRATYRDLDTVRSMLLAVRTRWKAFLVLKGLAALAVVLLGAVFAVAILAGFFNLPIYGRVILLVACAGCSVFALVKEVIRPLLRTIAEEEVARHVETAIPEMRNGLINALLLSKDESAPSHELVDRAITETVVDSDKHDFSVAVDTTHVRRLGMVVGALVLVLAMFSVIFPGRLSNALIRVFKPTDESLPFVGSVRITGMTPAKSPVHVMFGDPLVVTVKYKASGSQTVKGTMVWKYETGEIREVPMLSASADTGVKLAGGEKAVECVIPSVEVPLEYYVKLDDSTSARFKVVIDKKPFVENIDFEYVYPSYTGITPRKEFGSKLGNIDVPAGTLVRLTAHVDRPLSGGEVRFVGEAGAFVKLKVSDDGRSLSGAMTVNKNRNYAFHLVDLNERGSLETGTRRIRAIPDAKPTIDVISPARDKTVHPGETVTLAVRASDDYGLEKVTLWMKRNDESPVVLSKWDKLENRKADTLTYTLEVKKDVYRTGEVLAVYADVEDNWWAGLPSRPPGAPHRVSSGTRLLTVRDRAAEAKRIAEDVRSWKERLQSILRTQQKAKASASTLEGGMVRAAFTKRSASIAKDQLSVYEGTVAVATDMQKLEGEAARVARVTLAVLARNEMVRAIQLSATIARLKYVSSLGEPTGELLPVQDKIISMLKKVLDILPEIERQNLAEEDDEEGNEMPQDAQKKWKDLAEKLKEFADEQKKIIAQTNDLAKKPVDDFSTDDDDTLKELAAVEDEWAKFLKEAHKDLSKLPNQDFSNPSLLKELLEVQSDVEKAADALTRKEIEIAVPLEQAGVENAEELTTHIEKWLPDSADRDQWKMEEPMEDLETPMAELPKELEDIIGDLMEEEEDLFEEIEDASSAWTDSIDKGAGWDAMDGPISNMSAQGVTGNRLPNSSEIGGRSGEGRTGKSGGEMVEESATGKGGRRTPTRLTPDPYESGEVKDTAGEPAGGSTGGGKVSGGSKEGLEGPVPPPLAKKMKRLAGKQADLRNKAARVSVKFKVLNYDTTDIDKLIDNMKKVEDDLKNYRYRNVLRQKRILLKGLQTARLMLRNRIVVDKDASAGLPPEVQREIVDTAEHQLPAEYQDLVQKYYESLSEK